MQKYYLLFLVCVSALISSVYSCKKDVGDPVKNDTTKVAKPDTSAEFQVLYDNHTGWTYNKGIYEVNLRLFLQNSSLAEFNEQIPWLKNK